MKWRILIAALGILLLPATANAGVVPDGYGPIQTQLWQWQTTWYPDGRAFYSNATTGESHWDTSYKAPGTGLTLPGDYSGSCLHPASFGRFKWVVSTNEDCVVADSIVSAAAKGRKHVAGWKCNRPDMKNMSCKKGKRKIVARSVRSAQAVDGFEQAVALCGIHYAYQEAQTIYAKDERACDSADALAWKISAKITAAGGQATGNSAIDECKLTYDDSNYFHSCKTDYGCLVILEYGSARYSSLFVYVGGLKLRMLVEPQGGIPSCE